MAENLAYLPSVNDYSDNNNGYFVYDYLGESVEEAKSSFFYKKYGALYTYYAAEKASLAGWRLPSMDDWQQLAKFIQSENTDCSSIEGTYSWENIVKYIRAKEGWNFGINANDKYGFAAKPAGIWSLEGETYLGDEYYTSWWSYLATDYLSPAAVSSSDSKDRLYLNALNFPEDGYRSLRCIKNELPIE